MDTGSVSESKPIKLILRSILSPGDAMTLTAAIESLHLTYPNEYLTDVRTSTNEIWENNPFITPLRESDADVKNVEIKYPTVHCSKQTAVSFINAHPEFDLIEKSFGTTKDTFIILSKNY